MAVIGRFPISFPEEYEKEWLFLQNLKNRSKFVVDATVKFIADDSNLTDLEKLIKKQIFEK